MIIKRNDSSDVTMFQAVLKMTSTNRCTALENSREKINKLDCTCCSVSKGKSDISKLIAKRDFFVFFINW